MEPDAGGRAGVSAARRRDPRRSSAGLAARCRGQRAGRRRRRSPTVASVAVSQGVELDGDRAADEGEGHGVASSLEGDGAVGEDLAGVGQARVERPWRKGQKMRLLRLDAHRGQLSGAGLDALVVGEVLRVEFGLQSGPARVGALQDPGLDEVAKAALGLAFPLQLVGPGRSRLVAIVGQKSAKTGCRSRCGRGLRTAVLTLSQTRRRGTPPRRSKACWRAHSVIGSSRLGTARVQRQRE